MKQTLTLIFDSPILINLICIIRRFQPETYTIKSLNMSYGNFTDIPYTIDKNIYEICFLTPMGYFKSIDRINLSIESTYSKIFYPGLNKINIYSYSGEINIFHINEIYKTHLSKFHRFRIR